MERGPEQSPRSSERAVLEKLDARIVAMDAGLDLAAIHWEGKPRLLWQSILGEAANESRVSNVIIKARKRYPEDPHLKLAEVNQLQRAVWATDIRDEDWKGPTSGETLEKLMGKVSTLRPIWFLEKGLGKARSVCRVVLRDGSSGTGFLTGNNLLITNHHVLPDKTAAKEATAEFNFQQTLEGRDSPVDRYRLAPDQGFATSREDPEGDDWTAVRVEGAPDEKWGQLPLKRANLKVNDEVAHDRASGRGAETDRSLA